LAHWPCFTWLFAAGIDAIKQHLAIQDQVCAGLLELTMRIIQVARLAGAAHFQPAIFRPQ